VRAALQLSKLPSAEIYYCLGDILEDLGNYDESEKNFRKALETSKASGDPDLKANSIRGLVRTTYAMGRHDEEKAWFKSLIDSGKATAWDWESNGVRLERIGQFQEAARSYINAAKLGGSWTNWCQASNSFSLVAGEEDSVLSSARKCLSEGFGKKDSENLHAAAYLQIACVLNQRGVFQEALNHARESSALNPSDPWALDAQAEALIGLRRFQEAINAINNAIRLSDGKFSSMHFKLGKVYFKLANYEFALQSFKKAAELDPEDDASPYNVAICLIRLGYFRDAANWYEEVLRRNPTRQDKQTILDQIRRLRY
jgi:tetratricopeptide (TPR) repeat protein